MGVIADRLSTISESPTLKVGANAERMRRAGIDVIDLGAGEPDFNTPEHAKAAAVWNLAGQGRGGRWRGDWLWIERVFQREPEFARTRRLDELGEDRERGGHIFSSCG